MSSTSLRTIWLTLRATNYTTAVFTNVITNMQGLDAAQKQAINSSLNLGKSAFAAGMLFNVLGTQMGGTAGKVLTYASYMMYLVSALSYMRAGIIAATAFMQNHAIIVHLLSSSYVQLGIAMAGIMAAFLIFVMLKDSLGTIPALLIAIGVAAAAIAVSLWLAAGGMAGLTAGVSGYSGAASMWALRAASTIVGNAQMGTRMVPATGMMMVHQGEVIYNPATGRPTQVGNEIQNGLGGSTMIDASMHIDTLNTKMSKEELEEALRKQGRKIAVDRM
jgi:hypothetical protein